MYAYGSGHLTYNQNSWLYFWPPAMVLDFVAGAVVGELMYHIDQGDSLIFFGITLLF